MNLALVALLLAQAPGQEDTFVGVVEIVNPAESLISVRDRGVGRALSFVKNSASQFTKDGKPAAFSAVKKGDLVAINYNNGTTSTGANKRFIVNLDIRPTLNLKKLKIDQTGYLPPQSEFYFYEVEALVDDQTVLVREVSMRLPANARPGARNANLLRVPGELFMVSGISASDYVEGKQVALDSRYRVDHTLKATVTKEGPKVTVKREYEAERDTKTESKSQVKGKSEGEVERNGKRTNTNTKGTRDTEAKTKAKTQAQGKSAVSSQLAVTRQITAFVLVPIEGSQPSPDRPGK
jgi:hypothetical protein